MRHRPARSPYRKSTTPFIKVKARVYDLHLALIFKVVDDLLRFEIFCATSLAFSRTALSTKSPGLPHTALAAGTIAATMGPMKPGSFARFATTSQAASTAPTLVPENDDQRRTQMLGNHIRSCPTAMSAVLPGITHDEQLAQPDAAEDQLR